MQFAKIALLSAEIKDMEKDDLVRRILLPVYDPEVWPSRKASSKYSFLLRYSRSSHIVVSLLLFLLLPRRCPTFSASRTPLRLDQIFVLDGSLVDNRYLVL